MYFRAALRDIALMGILESLRPDVAALALYLCSPAARNVTGQAISVDGNIEYL